jgi:hypothetical protein
MWRGLLALLAVPASGHRRRVRADRPVVADQPPLIRNHAGYFIVFRNVAT